MKIADVAGAIEIRSIAGGSYDAAGKILIIGALADEVVFSIVSTGDITGHASVAVTIAELAGDGALPDGRSIASGAHVVTVEDNNRTIGFSRTRSFVREGDRMSAELEISQPLVSEDVAVPLKILGDANIYYLYNGADPETRLVLSGDPSFASERTAIITSDRSARAGSVTLVFDSRQDEDSIRESIAIDADSFPEGYALGANHAWTICINDDGAISLSSLHGRLEVDEGNRVSTQLQLSGPPLGQGEALAVPLLIDGDSDAYAVRTIAPSGARYENGMVHFNQDLDANSATLEFRARPDRDYDDDTVRFAIDAFSLPPGYYAGSVGAFDLFVRDNRTPGVFIFVPGETPDYFGALNLMRNIGEVVIVRIEVHPPNQSV